MSPLPEGLDDPGDTNAPVYQDEDPPVAPVADPTADMDTFSDNDSVLSEVDEAQFEDFDPTNISIEDRPAIAVDEDTVKTLGRYKRKRDADDGEVVKKKHKEGRREKPKKSRKKRDSDEDDFSGGQEIEGKRKRKTKAIDEGGPSRKEKARPRKVTPENEEALDPEERKLCHMTLLMQNIKLTKMPTRTTTSPRSCNGRRPQEPYPSSSACRRNSKAPVLPPPVLPPQTCLPI